jgi:hypothetical protein
MAPTMKGSLYYAIKKSRNRALQAWAQAQQEKNKMSELEPRLYKIKYPKLDEYTWARYINDFKRWPSHKEIGAHNLSI